MNRTHACSGSGINFVNTLSASSVLCPLFLIDFMSLKTGICIPKPSVDNVEAPDVRCGYVKSKHSNFKILPTRRYLLDGQADEFPRDRTVQRFENVKCVLNYSIMEAAKRINCSETEG